jgi:tetratricopeptide (TPR) repeat protein
MDPRLRTGFLRLAIVSFSLSTWVAPAAAAPCHDEHDDRALAADPRTATEPIAPVIEGLGRHHHPVTTRSERAQLFFDQGLKLTYGFNHQEALRSFKEAARLDPDCAMAYWGWALVLGPNLNLPMEPHVVPQAHEAIQLALARKDRVSAQERGYIEALARRYVDDPEADRAPLDAAYAGAMGALHRAWPEDTDAATLYAAALMEQSPWNYWTRDGAPRPETPEILQALESAMRRDPEHEGALHYYIHAVESIDAERGAPAADALRHLAPGAGHLVHMPSHIWMQLGRYADSYEVNARAARADEGYIAQCRAQGFYPLSYYPHNLHFMGWAATMQGRRAAALEAARRVAAKVPEDLHDNKWALYESFLAMPLCVMARFGMWQEILAEPLPREDLPLLRGAAHWARGLAHARSGRLDEARGELAALGAQAGSTRAAETPIGYATAARLLEIAGAMLAGEIEGKQGSWDAAVAHLDRAVRLEDGLQYNEPPDWFLPVRHVLGALLLEAGRPEEAEVVYWQDLREHRENGFALRGLWQSLKAQGRDEAAAGVEARFRAAWADADVELASSRF